MILQNALVYTPRHTFELGTIVIRDGRIVPFAAPEEGEEVLDAEGLYALPGLVDIHFPEILPCLLFVKIFKYLCQHFKTAHTIEFSSVENRKRTYYLCDITAMIIVKLVHHGFRGIIAIDDSGYLVAVNVLYCVLV